MNQNDETYIPPKKWRIGTISIDENGMWWVYWLGFHAQQGGIEFSPGNMGMNNIEDLLTIVAKDMQRCEGHYKDLIQKKQER